MVAPISPIWRWAFFSVVLPIALTIAEYPAGLFYVYADELRKLGQNQKAEAFDAISVAMGVNKSETPPR